MAEHENNGKPAGAGEQGKAAKVVRKDKRRFATADEARAAGRLQNCEKWGLFEVTTPDGAAVFFWAPGVGRALRDGAAHLGVKATQLDKPVNKEAVAASLAAMSPEERAALLEAYLPAKGKRK
jgi:hypothetical protein